MKRLHASVFLSACAAFVFTGPTSAQTAPPHHTVRGTVFEDANSNGRLDEGERVLPGFVVSDQESVVATNVDGAYALEVSTTTTLVFVSLPDGWAARGPFWRALKSDVAEQRVDFPLVKRPSSSEFIFIHASDTHVNAESLPRLHRFREQVELMRPAFVLITGDLVKDALRVPESEARGYYDMLVAELARFTVPVFTVPGNHENFGIERTRSLVSAQHPLYGKKMYRHYLGPNYYSFTWGGIHFLGLDTADIDDLWYYGHLDAAQLAWVRRDLGMIPAGTNVVTFNHIPLSTAVDVMNGYTDDPPAPSLIRINGKPQYRHIVSNTKELLDVLKPVHLEIALGGHMHVSERIAYDTPTGKLRFHQTGAIVGPSTAGKIEMASGFTLYHVRNGKVDDGTFIPLEARP